MLEESLGIKMKKTDNFFLIHNFNTVPEELLSYCRDYLVVDASTDERIPGLMEEKGIRFIQVENTGHNITTYFDFFGEQFDTLPQVMCICKGNMLGRHCSREYFDRVYNNRYFTYLYEDRESRARFAKKGSCGRGQDLPLSDISSLVSECQYIEENTSWYVDSPNHPHRYFDDFDELLRFIYKDPVIPRYCLFSPGACYILRREQVRKHSPAFYRNLNKLMNYGLDPSFPSEAHMIERMLPVIFEASYEENEWMQDEAAFDRKLTEREAVMQKKELEKGRRFRRLRRMLGRGE